MLGCLSSNPALPLWVPGLNDFCFMLMRTTKLKIPTIPNADKDAEKLDVSDVAGGDAKWCNPSGKVWWFFKH